MAIGLTNSGDSSGDRTLTPAAEWPLLLAPRLIFSAVSAIALVSGVIASGAFAASSEAWLTLLIGMVLTQIVWNTLWATIAETAWAQVLNAGRQWQTGTPLRQLPYTQPGSASAHASVTLGYLGHWLTQHFWPRYGAMLASTAGAIVIGLVLALVLGPQPAALAIVAVCIPQLAALLNRGKGQPAAIGRGLIMIGLPMALGHALFAPLTIDILVAALGFAIAYASIAQTNRAELFWIIGTAMILGLMIITRRPLGAFAVGILALPQVLLNPSRHRKGWLMAMLLAVGAAIS